MEEAFDLYATKYVKVEEPKDREADTRQLIAAARMGDVPPDQLRGEPAAFMMAEYYRRLMEDMFLDLAMFGRVALPTIELTEAEWRARQAEKKLRYVGPLLGDAIPPGHYKVMWDDGFRPISEPPRYYDYVTEERSPKDKAKAHWMSLNTADWRNKRKR